MASSNARALSPPIFNGENYQIWAMRMKALLKGLDLWEVVETGADPSPLRANSTVTQLKHYAEESAKKFKVLSYIHSAVSESIFTRIMACETGKEAWDRLREEFQGSENTRQMQVLNLRRTFEALKMKETENVKEYSDKVIKVVNQIRVLGEDLPDKRVVEKILVSLPERFEAKISSLKDSKDVYQISLAELVNALQATEQRRSLTLKYQTENAFVMKNKGRDQFNSEGKRTTDKRNKREEIRSFEYLSEIQDYG
ncbi:uncharacterized protein LOC131169324 [Hevea brasiliensis]|uniref:uncharacterized protein LOC131169324 n=1 Tax=Hevea brasiliensis TaxID=3981 RepID=UPI0025FDD61D|nr:uncharacterized protein LOC131169324 [Hevea brasiliensis]